MRPHRARVRGSLSIALCQRECDMPPAATEVAAAGAHLEEHGWCVIKNVVSSDVAKDSRDSEYTHVI
jgi:hypothetical protein